MRILLTGVNGQVGSALREPLQAFGTVLAADRGVLDLGRPEGIAATLDALAPDLIVNPAAYTAVDQAEDDAALAFTVNGEAPRALGRWAAPRGVPVIHFSTDYVFDGSGERAWREDDATAPLSVYGASKLAGETALREEGAPHLIMRTSWVFAARGRNFLTTMARLARERTELRVVGDQIGAPTSAHALASAVVAILTSAGGSDPAAVRSAFARADGLVHATCRGETSWHGFATEIVAGLRLRGRDLAVREIVAIGTGEFPAKAPRPRNSRLDRTRLETVFGVALPDWHAALSREIDAFRDEPASG
ncbi:MAG: dTDP-4-dehydrorhamnose reductase [Xanthobacteraceae bacterium]|nr:dTDP-4-dehydrorhamnose reductase [Xanthobacteraceae bacterium]